MITLEKTLPADELHMGALLREELHRQGLRVRVERLTSGLPYEVLRVSREGFSEVTVSAQDCNGNFPHYDIGRDVLMAVSATTFDPESRIVAQVYWGLDDPQARPVEQVENCGRAVAEHFGVDYREADDYFAEDHDAWMAEQVERFMDSIPHTGTADAREGFAKGDQVRRVRPNEALPEDGIVDGWHTYEYAPQSWYCSVTWGGRYVTREDANSIEHAS